MTTKPAVRLVLLLFAACLLVPVATARDLYTGETALAEGEAVTPAALLRALDQVLVRLTGRIDESPVAQFGIGSGDVQRMLQSQQRIRVERLDDEGRTQTGLHLRAEFYPAAVDQLLEAHGLARWGRERPAILLWVAEDRYDDGPQLLQDPVIEQSIREQARRFGLDIIRPLGDAHDMAEVRLADIRGGFLDAATEGARRYSAGVVAMLDLREEDGYWSGRWFWRLDGRDSSLSLTAERPRELVELGLAGLLESLARRYAVQVGEADGMQRVVVEGIVDPVQYAEVLTYLENLSLVQQLRVIGASGRQVEFELVLVGDGLDDAISMSRILTVDHRSADGRLHLRLQR